MEDYRDLPQVTPKESLEIISGSNLSVARKLLASSLVTQARSFVYRLQDSKEELMVLDVTRFLNHRINTRLIRAIGKEFAKKVTPYEPDIILTAPSSGNIPAIMTAVQMPSMPDVIYAPKGMPITMTNVYQAQSRSYTHGKSVTLTVSRDCIPAGSRVAICDDFLDTGKTATDLIQIASQAHATVVVLFFCLEKPFGGRDRLQQAGFGETQIITLMKIDSMRPGRIKLNGFDYWFEMVKK